MYDYVAGKADWIAAGRATDGPDASTPRAGGVADSDVMTCRLDDQAGEVARRLRAAGTDTAVVVDADNTVLGRLRLGRFTEDGAAVGVAMEEGPATVRASEPLDELLSRMRARSVAQVVVTTPEGQLLGIVRVIDDDA
ncbi:MAG TPA: CBS domain-containing protein [Acidimicrobiia bacterium]|nr:CBS domain-containing protein [Acidimicrobiia bacterium]